MVSLRVGLFTIPGEGGKWEGVRVLRKVCVLVYVGI